MRADEQQRDQLWQRWLKARDQVARNDLVVFYLPFVRGEVAKVAPSVAPSARSELMGFGTLGLFDAIEKFSPELGHRFESYAPFRIRGAILDGIRGLSWLPRAAMRPGAGKIAKVVTLDFQSIEPGHVLSLADRVVDTLEAPVFEELILEAEHEAVVDAVESLPERERRVILEYYYGERRMAEIGGDMGVTESRVSQIHRVALNLLRSALAEPLSA